MSTGREPPEGLEAKPRMDARTKLAFQRTFLAHERTQMAWVRTSLSLISFGFAIAKFYQFLRETQAARAPHFAPRTVGMLMISIGLISLVSADVQHRGALKELRSQCEGLPASTAGATAVVVMLLGVTAFILALL